MGPSPALMDSRIIDVNFSKTFMKLVLDYELPMTIDTVKVCLCVIELVSCADSVPTDCRQRTRSIARAFGELRPGQDFDRSVDVDRESTAAIVLCRRLTYRTAVDGGEADSN